jgi:COMPASS component SWD2
MAPGDPPPAPVAKVSDVVASFRPTRQFKAPSGSSYTSIDFDDGGEFLLLSRSDDTIQLYNTKAGAHAKELKSQKYGSAFARFTHHSTSIIYASTKIDDGIRYLSMHDNNFIRYFRGHSGRVTSLSLNPGNDTFMSTSMDNTVKLWDIRSSSAQGQLNFESPWLSTYDPSATVIAIGSPPAQTVHLYDLRNYDKPPFATFDLNSTESRFESKGQRPGVGWTGMEFSNNGKLLLVSTNGAGHYLLDAFTGDLVAYLQRPHGSDSSHLAPGDELPRHEPDGPTPSYLQASACFSPDGNYVVGGNGRSNGLSVWDATSTSQRPDKVLEPMAELPGQRPSKLVAYNQRHNLLASADKDVTLWLPDTDAA